MKGFHPPPRFGGAAGFKRAAADYSHHYRYRRRQREGLGGEAGARAKDLIAVLLMRGVFVTVNQSLDAELMKDMARHFGAETEFISFEDEMANEALENLMAQENAASSKSRAPLW